jgi:hypothetical protein
MPKFLVTATETVVVRYPPIEIEGADYANAAEMIDAMRSDGGLPDPISERPTGVSFEVEPILDTNPTPTEDAVGIHYCVTQAGRDALSRAEAQRSSAASEG